MFYAYYIRIFNLPMTNSLSNLISFTLSFQLDFTFISLFLFILWIHTYDDKTTDWYWETTTRELTTTRNRRIMGIYKTFDFLIFEVLVGLRLGSRGLLGPPNPKSTSSLFLITWRLP